MQRIVPFTKMTEDFPSAMKTHVSSLLHTAINQDFDVEIKEEVHLQEYRDNHILVKPRYKVKELPPPRYKDFKLFSI